MNRIFIMFLSASLLLNTADVFAHNSSSRSSSSSSRGSSSSYSKPAPKKITTTKKPSTSSYAKVTSSPKEQKSKAAFQKSGKFNRALAKKNASAASKYGNKSAATNAYKQKLESQNKYTSSTPPSTRPTYIPNTFLVGGTSYSPIYGMHGGSYMYGYHDAFGMFHPIPRTAYIVDDYDMMSRGYGAWGANGQPIHTAPTNKFDVIILLIIFGSIVGVIVIIGIVHYASKKGA